MKVCGWSTATRGPPGPVRPSVSSPANFFFGFGRSQRSISASATRKPDVVRGVRVATARGCRARRPASRPGWTRRASAVVVRRRLGLVARGALGRASASPRLGPRRSSGSPSSPTSAVSVSISSSTGSSVGGVIVAMTVSSRSSSSVTPSRDGDGRQRERLVHLQAGDVVDDRVRDVVRERLDVELARLLAEHAALGDAGRLVAAGADRARRRRGSAGSCPRAGGRGGSPRRAPDGSGRP